MNVCKGWEIKKKLQQHHEQSLGQQQQQSGLKRDNFVLSVLEDEGGVENGARICGFLGVHLANV